MQADNVSEGGRMKTRKYTAKRKNGKYQRITHLSMNNGIRQLASPGNNNKHICGVGGVFVLVTTPACSVFFLCCDPSLLAGLIIRLLLHIYAFPFCFIFQNAFIERVGMKLTQASATYKQKTNISSWAVFFRLLTIRFSKKRGEMLLSWQPWDGVAVVHILPSPWTVIPMRYHYYAKKQTSIIVVCVWGIYTVDTLVTSFLAVYHTTQRLSAVSCGPMGLKVLQNRAASPLSSGRLQIRKLCRGLGAVSSNGGERLFYPT